MEQCSPNPIPDLSADWGKDLKDPKKRPYSGQAVQDFLKKVISERPKFVYMSQEDVENLTPDKAVEGVIYCGLEGYTPSSWRFGDKFPIRFA